MTDKNSSAPLSVWARNVHEPFLRAALLIALTTGFGYGAIMVALLAFGITGTWYPALLQAHGHAQLFGWLGLFVLGMGLFFLPRLRGIKLKHQTRARIVFALLVAGIVLRTVAQPLAAWFNAEFLRALFLLAAFLEMAGMLLLGSIFFATERAAKPLSVHAPAYPVQIFLQLAFISFVLAVTLNLFGAWNAFAQGRNVIAARYDQSSIVLMLYGVAIPMAIVFSLRNLPLFLRLAMPSPRGWRALALVYMTALFLRVLPQLIDIADDALVLTGRVLSANALNMIVFDALAVGGILVMNACILIFVWRLDLLRRRPPWTSERAPNTRPDLEHLRQPTRENYPDNGEYGRFELLFYAAFAWLVVAVLLDVLRALPFVAENFTIPQDLARHALMVGFITFLIFGMAVRMAPGFSQKRGVAYPDLVMWLFVLGNAAAFLRVVLAFFPESNFALMLWGLSGFIGWCAVLVLTVMLWETFRVQPPRA